MKGTTKIRTSLKTNDNLKQAGAELGKAQLKLGLDFISIICTFGWDMAKNIIASHFIYGRLGGE